MSDVTDEGLETMLSRVKRITLADEDVKAMPFSGGYVSIYCVLTDCAVSNFDQERLCGAIMERLARYKSPERGTRRGYIHESVAKGAIYACPTSPVHIDLVLPSNLPAKTIEGLIRYTC